MKNPGLLLLSALACLLGPFAQAASTVPTSGLLITRVNSQQWEVRLIAGSDMRQFSGVFEANMPFTNVTAVKLENRDAAKMLTATSLGTTLTVSPGGLDGVNFTVSGDAQLCLRDTGSSGVQLYLGDSLDGAIPVSAPVALTSADSCGGTAPTDLAATSGRKFHAGHYVALLRNGGSQKTMEQSIKEAPEVKGFVKRYTWRELEPKPGVYQFSEIKSDLAWAAANGKYLIVMIEDRTFTNEKAGPADFDSKYEQATRSGGWVVERWQPEVVTRWIAMVKALGKQFDSHPNFEGLATQETSLGIDSAKLKANNYSPERYRDSYIQILTAAAAAMPTSRVFWFMNFFAGNQSYIGSIAAAVAPKGVLMGGPDVWPDNKPLASRTYPFYTQYQGKMPLFAQVEPLCYDEPHMTLAPNGKPYLTKYWTMQELFNYARTKLHVNYMFWVRLPAPPVKGAYSWKDTWPIIRANATFTPS